MISTPMPWIRQLEQFVPPGSLTKGRNYFRSGAVEIHKASADRVEATVKGGGRYWVVLDLDVDLQAVVASCTCRHYDDGNLCKHIWASLEAAEAEGHLGRMAEMDHATILTEIEYSGDDDEFDQLGELDEEDDDFGYRRHRAEYSPAPSPSRPPQIAAWKQHLTSVRAATMPRIGATADGKRHIIYLADVSQSLSAGGLVIQAAVQRSKKNWEWGKPAFQETSIRQVSQLDIADQRMLALLGISRSVQLLPVLLLTRTGFRSIPASLISRCARSAGIHAVRNGAIFLKVLPAPRRAVASPVGRCFAMVFQG